MSHRLQVLISPDLDSRLDKAATRNRISKGEWVRRALEVSLQQTARPGGEDSLQRLASLNAPAADLEQMLEEIEKGRL